MQEQWYYGRNGQRNGPVDEATLQQLAGSGQLSGGDLVWREGMTDWQPAGAMLPALFPVGAGAAAPVMSAGEPMSAGVPISPGAPVVLGYDSPAYAATQYAGFWWRVLAVLIDGIILTCVLLPLQFVLGLLLPDPAMAPPGPTGAPAPDMATVFLIMGLNFVLQHGLYALYYGLMESSRHQASVGKLACGLRVTDTSGQRISLGRAVGRYFASILSALILGIGYIMGAFTEKKQCLHDMIVGTVVLKGRPTR